MIWFIGGDGLPTTRAASTNRNSTYNWREKLEEWLPCLAHSLKSLATEGKTGGIREEKNHNKDWRTFIDGESYQLGVGMWFSWLEHGTGTPPTQIRFPGAARDFSPRVNFQCRLSYGIRTPPCAIACIYICAHVKDPVFHVRVRWIMETLKHPACTVGWVARLCCSWLSQGKKRQSEFSMGEIPMGQ